MNKINYFLVLLFICSISSGWASSPSTTPGRDHMIQSSLDCMSKHSGNDGDVTWENICYKASSFEPSNREHMEVVNEQLNALQNGTGPDQKSNDKPVALETSFDAGMRWDKLQWSIADTDGNPDVLSELTWKNIQSFAVGNKGDLAFYDKFILDWNGSYAWVYHGDNQDSDYFGNGRTFEFSRSNNKSDIGHMMDLSGGLGWRFNLTDASHQGTKDFFMAQKLDLDVLGGYAYNEQQYYMTDGFQTIPSTGSFSGLKSNYEAQWRGPWLGFQLKGQQDQVRGFFRFEYHLADYYGKANWNLRPDFQHPKSYEHETSNGLGLVFSTGVGFLVTPCWSIDLSTKYQYWDSGSGTDRVFFSNGTTAETKLNESVWKSTTVSLGNTIHF